MLGAAAPYVVAMLAMMFAGISALTLFYAVRHFDPPEAVSPPAPVDQHVAV